MYKDWIEAIAMNRELKWTDLRVFIILLANIEQDVTAEIAQAEIGAKLGIETSNVSRSIKKLTQVGAIEKKMQMGKLVGYKFTIENQE